MAVFLHPRGRSYQYDFRFKGQRYQGSTHTTNVAEAKQLEDAVKRELRLEWGGLVPHRLLKGVTDRNIEIVDGRQVAVMNPSVAAMRTAAAERIVAEVRALPTDEAQGQIYFIEQEQGPIKIGYSVDPLARLKGLQTSSPTPLRLLATMPGTVVAEQRLHMYFEEFRVSGEWFARDARLLAIVDAITHVEVPAVFPPHAPDLGPATSSGQSA